MRAAAALLCLGLVACAKHAPPPRHAEAPPPEPPPPEPAPAPPSQDLDDGMTVKGTLGTLTDGDVEETFHARWEDVTHCMKDAQPHLAYLGGRVELKMRIDASGTPEKAHVQSSTLGHYGAEKCLLELANSLKFPPPRGGPYAEFSFPFEFKPARTAIAPVDWTVDNVGPAVLDRSRVALDACALPRSATAPKPKPKHKSKVAAMKPMALTSSRLASLAVPAKLRVTLYILPGGKVSAAGLSADAPIAPDLASCFVEHASALRFDDPGGHVAKLSFGVAR